MITLQFIAMIPRHDPGRPCSVRTCHRPTSTYAVLFYRGPQALGFCPRHAQQAESVLDSVHWRSQVVLERPLLERIDLNFQAPVRGRLHLGDGAR